MKKVLVILMLIFAFGCSDDVTEPSKNTVVGKWKVNVTPQGIFEQTYIVLEFTSDGKFNKNIEPVGIQANYVEGTYSTSDSRMNILSDDCGALEGSYKFEFRDNGVEFTLIEDECEEREYIVGFFEKYSEPIFE